MPLPAGRGIEKPELLDDRRLSQQGPDHMPDYVSPEMDTDRRDHPVAHEALTSYQT